MEQFSWFSPDSLTKRYQRKTGIFQSDPLCPSKINNLNLIIRLFTKIVYDWQEIQQAIHLLGDAAQFLYISQYLYLALLVISQKTQAQYVSYPVSSSLIPLRRLQPQAQSVFMSNKQRVKFILSDRALVFVVFMLGYFGFSFFFFFFFFFQKRRLCPGNNVALA